MQYHMPHEVEKKKKEEIFTPLDELTLSQHSKLGHRCDACKLGHIHPPLETSGQKIERPRSALSPNTVKPAEIWTPQKAFAVAEELSLSSQTEKRGLVNNLSQDNLKNPFNTLNKSLLIWGRRSVAFKFQAHLAPK